MTAATGYGVGLDYGADELVPTATPSAFGARLIIDQDGHVDMVHDRVDRYGDTRVIDLLEARCPWATLRTLISGALQNRILDTRRAGAHVLFIDEVLTIACDTKASAGYLYLAAWVKP